MEMYDCVQRAGSDEICEEVTSDSQGVARFAVPAQSREVNKLKIKVSAQLGNRPLSLYRPCASGG